MTIKTLESNLTKLLADQQLASLNFVANDIEKKITLRTIALQDVADSLPADQLNDSAIIKKYLVKRLAIYRLFSYGVVVIGLNGMSIADHPSVPGRSNADFNELEYFKQVVLTDKPAIGKPRIGRFTNKPGVAIAVPIHNHFGKLVGVMAGFIGLTDQNMFDQTHAHLGKNGEYILISVNDRLIITDTDDSHTLQPIRADIHDNNFDRFLAGEDGTAITEHFYLGKALSSAKHILDGQWLIIGFLPITEALEPIKLLKKQVYLSATAILFTIAMLIWWLMHHYLRSITETTKLLANMVDQKDLHEVPVKSEDEVGQLLKTFNRLQYDIQNSQNELWQQKEFLKSIFDSSPECIKIVAPDGSLMDMNSAGLLMLEVDSLAEANKLRLLDFIEPEFRSAFIDLHKRVMAKQSGVLEFRITGRKGTLRWLETHATPLFDAHGNVTALLGLTRDITERMKLRLELEKQAHFDFLTGLANRRYFLEQANHELFRARRYNNHLSLLMIDIDHFKKVNDIYGHGVGDNVLHILGDIFRQHLRDVDVAGRMGGEEFAVILPETTIDKAIEIAERLREVFASTSIRLENGSTFQCTISIGASCLMDKLIDLDILLHQADTALYVAKQKRNQVYMYSD